MVHSFVRSHPLLADGEAGRLFHYLRVSKGQEGAAAASASFRLSGKAQQQQEPLVLPDYVSCRGVGGLFGGFIFLRETAQRRGGLSCAAKV